MNFYEGHTPIKKFRVQHKLKNSFQASNFAFQIINYLQYILMKKFLLRKLDYNNFKTQIELISVSKMTFHLLLSLYIKGKKILISNFLVVSKILNLTVNTPIMKEQIRVSLIFSVPRYLLIPSPFYTRYNNWPINYHVFPYLKHQLFFIYIKGSSI